MSRRYGFDEEHFKMFTKKNLHSILALAKMECKFFLVKRLFTVVNKKEMLKCYLEFLAVTPGLFSYDWKTNKRALK